MGTLIITDTSKFDTRVDEIFANTTYKDVKDTINNLRHELIMNHDICSLCAPQINKNLRLFVVKTATKEYKAFLNPMIVKADGLHLSRETNPCFPGKTFIIPRKNEIHVAYQEPNGQANSATFKGAYAEVIQQMIEMLDGITLADYGLDLDDLGGAEAFDKMSDEDKVTALKMYTDHLKKISGDFAKEAENNPEIEGLNKNIEFMTKYLNGEIRPLDAEGNIVEPKKETK